MLHLVTNTYGAVEAGSWQMPICKLVAANIQTSFFYMIRLLGPVHIKKALLGGLALFAEVNL